MAGTRIYFLECIIQTAKKMEASLADVARTMDDRYPGFTFLLRATLRTPKRSEFKMIKVFANMMRMEITPTLTSLTNALRLSHPFATYILTPLMLAPEI